MVTKSEQRWQAAQHYFAAAICAALLFVVGIALSNWFGEGYESMRTVRTTGFFGFSTNALYILILQSCLCVLTRRAWISLFIFSYFMLMFMGTFAWSGPNDQMKVAETLMQFHMGLAISLVAVNVIVCRILEQIFPERPSKPVAHQLKFDF